MNTQLGKSLKSGWNRLKVQYKRLSHGLDEISLPVHLLVGGLALLLTYFGEVILSTIILFGFLYLAWYLGSDDFDEPDISDHLGMV